MLADLERSGFSAEMKAIRTFRTRKWHCDGSVAYFDKDEERSREIDFKAYRLLRREVAPGTYADCWFDVVGGVRRAQGPWVVFRQPLEELFDERLDAWNNLAYLKGSPPWNSDLVPAMSKHSLLTELGWRCYGIHESFKPPDKASRWYSAFVTVSKASEQDLSDTKDHYESWKREVTPDFKGYLTFVFVQPVVVLDGELIAADLAEGGQISLEEVAEAPTEFVFRSRGYRQHHYRVDLTRLDNLPRYVQRCEARQESIVNAVARRLKEALA